MVPAEMISSRDRKTDVAAKEPSQERSSPWLSVQASAQVENNDTIKPNTQKDSVPHLFFTILNALREGPPY